MRNSFFHHFRRKKNYLDAGLSEKKLIRLIYANNTSIYSFSYPVEANIFNNDLTY